MTSLLFGVIASALLSVTSLLIVLLRVSPLSAPGQALPAFLLSLLLSISSVGSLILYAIWTYAPLHYWDSSKILSVSVRQGIFLGLACTLSMLIFVLGALSWWMPPLIFLVFVLVELAMNV
jgi:hypothetical protein